MSLSNFRKDLPAWRVNGSGHLIVGYRFEKQGMGRSTGQKLEMAAMDPDRTNNIEVKNS